MSSILVVEAEGAISRLLNDELESEEYQTVKVLNGNDAVQFALREIPRLIISGIGATPDPSFKFDDGQCATWVPVRAKTFNSFSSR